MTDQSPTSYPNILLLMCDQLRQDALAEQGVRFSNM